MANHPSSETWGPIYVPLFAWFERRDSRSQSAQVGWAEEKRVNQLVSPPKSQQESGKGEYQSPSNHCDSDRKMNSDQARVWCCSPLSQKEWISHQINQLTPVDEASHTSVGSSWDVHLSALKWHHVNSQADAKLDEAHDSLCVCWAYTANWMTPKTPSGFLIL